MNEHATEYTANECKWWKKIVCVHDLIINIIIITIGFDRALFAYPKIIPISFF